MFYGYYEHSLDDKGRLVIPSKMREEAGRIVYIMKGFDGALAIYKEEAFKNLVMETQSHPFNKRSSRDYLRIQLSSACDLEVDKQGRVQIPSTLLSKYHVGKDVVVIGVVDHIEVWDKEAYKAYEEKAISEFEENAENLESKE